MPSPASSPSHLLAIVVAGLVAGAVPLSAQGHMGGHGDGADHRKPDARGMMGPGGHGMGLAHVPTALLHQKELLELSDRQVEEIEAIRKEMQETRQEARSDRDRRAMHEDIASAFGPDGIDVSAYEEALREKARLRVDARVAAARRAQRALEVLDADQRSRFLYGLRLMHRMHRMGGMHRMRGEGGPPPPGQPGAGGDGPGGARP